MKRFKAEWDICFQCPFEIDNDCMYGYSGNMSNDESFEITDLNRLDERCPLIGSIYDNNF